MADETIQSTHLQTFPYQEAFLAIELTLDDATKLSKAELATALAPYEFMPSVAVTGTDDHLYEKLVDVAMYSGMSAATVTERQDAIRHHFADFRVVAQYTEQQVQDILKDDSMLKNAKKVQACVNNAKRFVKILTKNASIAEYFNTFGPFDSDEKIQRFRDTLIAKFSFLGAITVYHYMMDLKMPVAKPDRVLQRIFYRLGLTADPHIKRQSDELTEHLWNVVQHAQAFANASAKSIRCVDITFMGLGQEKIVEFGLEGTCLESQPKCHRCQAVEFCTMPQIAT